MTNILTELSIFAKLFQYGCNPIRTQLASYTRAEVFLGASRFAISDTAECL